MNRSFAPAPAPIYRGQGEGGLAQYHPKSLDENCQDLLFNAIEKLGLSARAYDRILKVSRTIADLAGTDKIRMEHVTEVIQYRSLDRKLWMDGGCKVYKEGVEYEEFGVGPS